MRPVGFVENAVKPLAIVRKGDASTRFVGSDEQREDPCPVYGQRFGHTTYLIANFGTEQIGIRGMV